MLSFDFCASPKKKKKRLDFGLRGRISTSMTCLLTVPAAVWNHVLCEYLPWIEVVCVRRTCQGLHQSLKLPSLWSIVKKAIAKFQVYPDRVEVALKEHGLTISGSFLLACMLGDPIYEQADLDVYRPNRDTSRRVELQFLLTHFLNQCTGRKTSAAHDEPFGSNWPLYLDQKSRLEDHKHKGSKPHEGLTPDEMCIIRNQLTQGGVQRDLSYDRLFEPSEFVSHKGDFSSTAAPFLVCNQISVRDKSAVTFIARNFDFDFNKVALVWPPVQLRKEGCSDTGFIEPRVWIADLASVVHRRHLVTVDSFQESVNHVNQTRERSEDQLNQTNKGNAAERVIQTNKLLAEEHAGLSIRTLSMLHRMIKYRLRGFNVSMSDECLLKMVQVAEMQTQRQPTQRPITEARDLPKIIQRNLTLLAVAGLGATVEPCAKYKCTAHLPCTLGQWQSHEPHAIFLKVDKDTPEQHGRTHCGMELWIRQQVLRRKTTTEGKIELAENDEKRKRARDSESPHAESSPIEKQKRNKRHKMQSPLC